VASPLRARWAPCRAAARTALLAGALLALPGTARADGAFTVTRKLTHQIDVVLTNVCVGEPIAVAGELAYVTRVTVDTQGGLHMSSAAVARNLTGTGLLTGTRYRMLGGVSESYNDRDSGGVDPPWTYTWTDTAVLVSEGGADNLLLHTTSHSTLAANGESTASPYQYRIECVG
jgi:hypothetical protein